MINKNSFFHFIIYLYYKIYFSININIYNSLREFNSAISLRESFLISKFFKVLYNEINI